MTADETDTMIQQHATYRTHICLSVSSNSGSVDAAVNDLRSRAPVQLRVRTFVQNSRQRGNAAPNASASGGSRINTGASRALAAQIRLDGAPREQRTDPLLCRCESLLDNWSTLVGGGNEIMAAFRTATARIGFVSASLARRSWFGGTRAGAPVEFPESIARRDLGPAFVCDPAPATACDATRIDVALERARAFLEEVGLPSNRIDPLIRVANVTEIWLGAQAKMRTVHLQTTPLECGRASAHAARTWLHMADINYPSATRRALALAADKGRLRAIAYTRHPDGSLAAHFTYCHSFDSQVVSLAAACEVPREPLVHYTEDLLRVQPHHVQRRAQLTFTVSGSGVIKSFTLAHYVAPYFRSDAELRAAVLSNASAFDWQVAPYRAVSKLIGLPPDGSRARCYMSFTVARTGDARLDSYASSARLFLSNPPRKEGRC